MISGIRFQPRKCLIVNPQDELSGAEIAVIFENEIISCVHFKIGSAILRLSGIQLFAPVHNWSQAPLARRTLPLMQNSRNCNSTGISVQHKFALRIRLRQGSCLDQSQFNDIESLSLLIPPGESRTQAGNSMQGGNKFGMLGNKLAIMIGEAQKALQLCLVSGYFPIAQFRQCFRVRFDTFGRDHTSQVLDLRLHKVALSDSHLKISFSQTFKHLA